MYWPLCKRFQLLGIASRVRVLTHTESQLGFLQSNAASHSQEPTGRFLSTSTSLEKQKSFTVSYLINSCGLSLETAKSASQKLNFETPEKPDSVLGLLRNYGFTNTHITNLVRKHPGVLVANLEQTLVPKFEFFHSIGIANDDLVKFVSSDPSILRHSLEFRLLPLYNFLKSVVSCDHKVVKVFMRLKWLSSTDVQKNFAPNIAVLRQLGARESSISFMLTSLTNVLCHDRIKFDKIVKDVISMGYDPAKSQFVMAIYVFSSMRKSTVEHKTEVYKRWGWSDNEIRLALKKCPIFMALSEKKIMDSMDFLVNKMGYQSAYIASCPSPLCFNLEKRTIPRCLVIKVLLLKGLLKKELKLTTFLNYTEKKFMEKFVTGYQEDIPLLLNIYQGKTCIFELGFSSDEIRGLKAL